MKLSNLLGKVYMNINSYKEHAKDFTQSKYKKIISKLKKNS